MLVSCPVPVLLQPLCYHCLKMSEFVSIVAFLVLIAWLGQIVTSMNLTKSEGVQTIAGCRPFAVHVVQEASCIAPGSSMRITSTEETIHLTLAYAAVSAMFEAYREYQIIHDDKGSLVVHLANLVTCTRPSYSHISIVSMASVMWCWVMFSASDELLTGMN